jgi:hypothetical protein
MRSGSDFLLAARQCEIAELEQLGRTAELVGVIARFIHALQRERGMSSIFLSSHGAQFGEPRAHQVAECLATEGEVRERFERMATGSADDRSGSRLFSRVAVVLHGLEGLPRLRERVDAQGLGAAEAAVAFGRLISGLLAVVFVAADTATDPEVSRALVALFNFMQGKEFAGQERALGARAFATGVIDSAGQEHWRHLIESQQGCFQVFADFSDPQVLRAEQAARDPAVLAEVERLRRIGCTARRELEAGLANRWYDYCTRRIDAMRSVEDLLAVNLRDLCGERIAQARAELQDQRATLDALSSSTGAAPGAAGAARFGPLLERSLFNMVQEQSRRLQAMSDELDAVRATLNERKLIERAKGLLMAHRQMSEDEAYKALRQMAMNQNRRILDVANAVLSLADVLPGGR